ncbi:P-loop containing nucleoside triphosphate hydrolase protein [Aspergillus avenaceus]|uniref:P-loop containing nucleoside triphosphate hydrolase protein n=1 Tax=Aspergillus avenaceus TaxID=36643 RepID=A0A5N6TWL7_ASPAV|nr:P-loop containing nucleoside triphosphate hydrolase protein [Aspergillus avenaceus]
MGMSFALVHYHYLGQVVGSQVKAVLTALIFDKSLNVSNNGVDDWTDGKISNLITVDSQRIESALLYANMIWSEPMALAMVLAILFYNLTWSALSGLVLLIIGAKCLDYSMGWLVSRRVAINVQVDRRTSSLLEALRNVRFLKFHAWEPYFLGQIHGARANEVRQQHGLLNLQSTIMSLSTSLPTYAAMFSFIIFMVANGSITAEEAFSSLALFNCLRKPLNILPMVVSQLTDAWVSIQRIEAFLLTSDHQETVVWDYSAANVVAVSDGCFTWDRDFATDIIDKHPSTEIDEAIIQENTPLLSGNEGSSTLRNVRPSMALQDISVSIKQGELVAVIGSVGSGKSALILALAGQMTKVRGTVTLGASRSICYQTPWIESGTVRDNILFGKPWRQAWYDQVVEACALQPDLNTWKNGDATSIGEHGITLSGDQKQRINLARAIYADADLLLLDDPLSAVDADVGHHIFHKAILGLLREKTCLLVTHKRGVLSQCDRVLWLEKGGIKDIEEFPGSRFRETLSGALPNQDIKQPARPEGTEHRTPSNGALGGTEHGCDLETIIEKETQGSGSIERSVYKAYFSASGSILHWPLLLFLLLISQVSGIFTGIWLSLWVDNNLDWDRRVYVFGYVFLAALQSTLVWAYIRHASIVGLQASDVLFQMALRRVLFAPMSFHTANPVGRLMNLFSSDVNQLDNGVSGTIRDFFMLIGIAFSTFLLVSIQFPVFITSFPVIALAMYYTSSYYRASRQELKRYETVSRSSVASKAIECITGRQTIRSFGAQGVFNRKLRHAIDEASNFTFLLSASQQWLNIRLDTLGNFLLLFIGALIVVSGDTIPASMSGLIMTYAIAVVQILPAIVSQTANVETSFITVERMLCYGSVIPNEISTSAMIPPPTWPEAGTIKMKNVTLRYRSDLPAILHNINLTFDVGTKIGIIGRTGAGKSSLLNVLFRLYPLEAGSVTIDHIDIANVDLHSLRSRLSIIPQDPALFQGTVRSNLDPMGEYSEEILGDALYKVGLYPHLTLDGEVQADGRNYSLGERQLLALARALMRDSRILVCDEATSAVDLETDRAVQRTIQEAFRGRTVICIAHRLQTVIGYDRICMMDQGRVVAFESPDMLFEMNEEFREMYRRLIRINRKGRPFSTCSVCHNTPCPRPEEHSKLKREAEAKSSKNITDQFGLFTNCPETLVVIAQQRPREYGAAGTAPASAAGTVACETRVLCFVVVCAVCGAVLLGR